MLTSFKKRIIHFYHDILCHDILLHQVSQKWGMHYMLCIGAPQTIVPKYNVTFF